jgi:Uma2 family endonuclease
MAESEEEVRSKLMSTIIPTEPRSPGVGPEWLPSQLYRMTLEQYETMVASGAFAKRDRVHLINGYLVARMTELPPHGAACDAIHLTLEPLLPSGWFIRIDRAIRIPNYASMPEPDIVVVRGTWRDYKARYPEPPDTAMIVEVANSSLDEDRAMAAIYGAGAVPIYWIINLVDRQVEVYTDPGPAGFQSRQIFRPGEQVPVVIGGALIGTIAVEDVLP